MPLLTPLTRSRLLLQSPLIPDGGRQAWEARRQLNMGLKTEDQGRCLGLGGPSCCRHPAGDLKAVQGSLALCPSWGAFLGAAGSVASEREHPAPAKASLAEGGTRWHSLACQAAQGGKAWGERHCREDTAVLCRPACKSNANSQTLSIFN